MKNNDDSKIVFSGTTISKKNANKVGLGFIFGLAGVVFSVVVFDNNKPAAYVTCTICIVAGFVVGNKIFK